MRIGGDRLQYLAGLAPWDARAVSVQSRLDITTTAPEETPVAECLTELFDRLGSPFAVPTLLATPL